MNSRISLKYFIDFVFVLLFFFLSIKTFIAYFNGDVMYDVQKDSTLKSIPFPSVTLCPVPQVNPIMNIDLTKLIIDTGVEERNFEGYMIWRQMNNFTDIPAILQNYSYTKSQIFKEKSKNMIM